MRIGELADATGVSTKAIRYYESIDLMKEPDRTPSGYRDYSEAALERLQFIRQAQATGLTLSEINAVLDLKDAGARSCEHTQTLLTEHLADLDNQIERLKAARRQLAELSGKAVELDPATCTDPNRCQVIDATRHPQPA